MSKSCNPHGDSPTTVHKTSHIDHVVSLTPDPVVFDPITPREGQTRVVTEWTSSRETIDDARDTAANEVQYTSRTTEKLDTMFGELQERNVVFCVDTSGSMILSLDVVKAHLIRLLETAATDGRLSMFNIVEFNSEVLQWSDSMVRCTPETVAEAAKWIQALAAKTGTNTRDALCAAFADFACDAVYLITDGYPDQHPVAVLDAVADIWNHRPVHCLYIQDDLPDSAIIQFLKDLAMETYGSFNIAILSPFGRVKEIIPVYTANLENPTTIQLPRGYYVDDSKYTTPRHHQAFNPDDEVYVEPVHALDKKYLAPYPDYYSYHHPYRYYFYVDPSHGWSRYRPSHMSEHAHAMTEASSKLPERTPSPGGLLLGTRVLVRRHKDGLYYLGTVQRQINEHKFMVLVNMSSQGKFKEGSSQASHLYDIISYTDAVRHSLYPGDKVLAPRIPNGDSFAPATVLEGHEDRSIQGNSQSLLTVSFTSDGQTASVAPNTAVWLPPELHERIAFELSLPRKVRMEMVEQEEFLEEEQEAGYPHTMNASHPPHYEPMQPGNLYLEDTAHYNGMYRSPYFHHINYRPQWSTPPRVARGSGGVSGRVTSAVCTEDMNALIPGTEMTSSALNEKVRSQIAEFHNDDRLLGRRAREEENRLCGKLEKSVSFVDSGRGTSLDDLEEGGIDSGHGSGTEFGFSDLEISDGEEGKVHRRWGEGQLRRRRKRVARRPPWRYWPQAGGIPDLIESNNYGPYRLGPYTDNGMDIPIESRLYKRNQYGEIVYDIPVEWTSAMSRYVNPLATSVAKNESIYDCMYVPRPPGDKPGEDAKQAPGVDVSLAVGELQQARDQANQERWDARRQHEIERRANWAKRCEEVDQAKHFRQEQHRAEIVGRLHQDACQREAYAQKMAETTAAKRAVTVDIRTKQVDQKQQQWQKEDARQTALQASRTRHEAIRQQREKEIQDTIAKRKEIREKQINNRIQNQKVNEVVQLSADEAREQMRRNAKVLRIERYHKMEADAQKKRNLKYEVSDRCWEMARSQVFP